LITKTGQDELGINIINAPERIKFKRNLSLCWIKEGLLYKYSKNKIVQI